MAKEVFAPGEYISEELEARGWTQDDLARIMGRSLPAINKIISAKAPLTTETAMDLGAAFGTSAEVWLNLEAVYRLAQSNRPNEDISRRARLYTLAPVKSMQKRRWLSETKTTGLLEAELCKFYSVSTLDEFPDLKMAARASGAGEEETRAARLAWGMRIVNLARELRAQSFDKTRLEEGVRKLRELAGKAEGAGLVPDLLATLGIRFVVVEHLPRTKIDGAALWLSEKEPLIGMSLRYNRIDYFWHTLMHEISHIRHGDEAVDADLRGGREPESKVERRADAEAAGNLIDPTRLEGFRRAHGDSWSRGAILRFAEQMGIHPGIVVGQLQHCGIIPYSSHRQMLVKIRHYVLENASVDGWPVEKMLAHEMCSSRPTARG